MPDGWLNVPHYKQEFPYSCVAACVRMVLAHYGCTRTEGEVRELVGTGSHGTPARAIQLVAGLGFDVQLTISNAAQLMSALSAGVPPIVFLDTGFLDYWHVRADHVAVLIGMDSATIYLNDPYFDSAPRQVSLADFQQAWAANEQLAALIRPHPQSTPSP